MTQPLLVVNGLVKTYGGRGRQPVLRAVDNVSFTVGRGEILGVVGESGSGKSTTARCVNRLIEPDSGSILLDGTDIVRLRGAKLRGVRRKMQMVFQDPYASLNPRMTVEELVGEGIKVHGLAADAMARRARVIELLSLVGLDEAHLARYPREFSGGQRQRIGIARALAVEPQLLICDEPVSSLDVSVQAQVLNLLLDLRDELGLSILFIAHDLAVVRHLCDRIAVMRAGSIVEVGTREQVYGDPQHPYTQALLRAIPVPDPDIEAERRRDRSSAVATASAYEKESGT